MKRLKRTIRRRVNLKNNQFMTGCFLEANGNVVAINDSGLQKVIDYIDNPSRRVRFIGYSMLRVAYKDCNSIDQFYGQ